MNHPIRVYHVQYFDTCRIVVGQRVWLYRPLFGIIGPSELDGRPEEVPGPEIPLSQAKIDNATLIKLHLLARSTAALESLRIVEG